MTVSGRKACRVLIAFDRSDAWDVDLMVDAVKVMIFVIDQNQTRLCMTLYRSSSIRLEGKNVPKRSQ